MIWDQAEMKNTEESEEHFDPINESEKFFSSSSNLMFQKGVTLLKMLKGKIFDQIINNKEYQCVFAKDFFNELHKLGLEMNKWQWEILIDTFTTCFDKSIFEVNKLEEVYWRLGVGDDLPQSNDLLDFTKIDITSIWILNKLIAYMDQRNINLNHFLGDSLK